MKWKTVIILFVIGSTSFFGMVKYYGFSWQDILSLSFYENLANPSVRIIKVQEGLRKEEIATFIGDKLGWDASEKKEFANTHLAIGNIDAEGYFFPKSYLVNKDANPSTVGKMMIQTFKDETSKIKKTKATKILNEDTAVKIASIIQREAGGKSDMKLISGIIWNRIFAGMKLQMDATLQYAKGSEEDGWWPQVVPNDKNIESPYNTYMYASLPPTAIANPGISALEAAYNPQKTTCMFYIHDKWGQIHCSKTYEEHKKNIARYY